MRGDEEGGAGGGEHEQAGGDQSGDVQAGEEVAGPVGLPGDGAVGGDPHRPAGLAGGVVDPRGQPGALGWGGGDGRGDDGRGQNAQSDAPAQHPRQQLQVRGGRCPGREQADPGGGEQQPGQHRQLGSDPGSDATGERGQYRERQEQRQHRDAGSERRAVLQVLQEQGEQKQQT